jgi:putative DNA primase/helicase
MRPEHTGFAAVFAEAQRRGWANPAAKVQGPDPRAQADPSDILTQAIDRLAADPGAVLTEAAVTAWREVYDQSGAEYERLRAKAKKAGARVAEIDRAIGARSKYAKKRGGREKNTELNSSYTPYTLNTDKGSEDIETYTDPFSSYTSCTEPLPVQPGALVKETEAGPRLKIASDAALTVASALKDRFAYCPTAQTWHGFTGAHWEPMANPAPLHEALTRWMYPATDGLGFTPRYQDSILLLIQRAAMRPLPAPSRAIPFANGLLDLETGALVPIAPGNALTWSLPYDYREGADCPRIKAWLLEAVGGDQAVRELLRAFLSAAIRGGAHLQRFLHLIGPGGTGKSTLLRLIEALVGARNVVSTDLKELEQNRFEAASLYGKRAALITDSDKYGGSVNKLKAITGQDPIRLERKHVQQSGSFIFDGLVFLASNEPLATTDYTSGLERRRVTVAFDRRVSDEEKAAWSAQGGEKAVLHAELPGLVNWLLAMPQAEAERIIRNPPTAVTEANLEAMCAGNPAADWLTEWCIPDPEAWVQIGKCVELRDRDTGRTSFEHQDFMLYPNYLAWCKASGRTALSLRRFRSVVVDAVKTLGHDVLESRRSQGQGVQGVRLRAPTEDPYTWLSVQSGVGSARGVGSDAASYTAPGRASVGCAGDVGFGDQITPAPFAARTHAASAEFQAPDTHPDVLTYLDQIHETDPRERADLIRRASEDPAVLRSIRDALRAAP